MRRIHTEVDTVTAFLATLVAGLSLALPIDFRWTSESSPLQLNLLAYSQPRAVAAGAIVAVVVATVLTAADSEVVSWCTALCGIAIVTANHLVGYNASPGASLATMNFLDAAVGGLLLASVGTAVMRRRIPTAGWLLGMVASISVAEALPSADHSDDGEFRMHWTATDSPPVWLICVTLALVAVSTYQNRRRPDVQRMSVELPMAPIVSGLLLVAAGALTSGWVTRSGDSTVVVVAAVALATLAAGLAALLLPDHEGVFPLMAVAVTAAGNALISATLEPWSVPLFLVLAGGGLAAGMRWPHVTAGFGAAAAVALASTVLVYLDSHSGVIDRVGNCALAVVVGYGLGAALPRRGSSRVIGVVLIVAPSAVLALRTRLSFGDCAEDPSPGGGLVCEFDGRASAVPGWAAVAVITGCLLFARMLLRRRVDKTPSGA
ncbi:hypothetical protein BJY24_000990 [Nocardia transvalensis]|uniref:Uncharacterized protein n=1 Tax=Nocardia transvalensis TaxID=37333 RepID=A0A7W9UGC1_9NOCA|nr:hypothetical protein [Nocardia transvalensis]MBB5912123.1 hypothetical protein [Nocardia transvalensis]